MTNEKRKAKGPFCGAKKRKGGACTQPAGWGTSHLGVGTCKLHGGSAPAAQLKGMVELARREMGVMGAPIDIEPQDFILECIRITAGEIRYASEKIAALEERDAIGPPIRTMSRDCGEDHVEERREDPPQLHIWIRARREAMDRGVAYSFAALKAGIEERRVRIAEQQGMLLAQAIQGVLRELGVDQNPEAPRVVRKHLELVAGQFVA